MPLLEENDFLPDLEAIPPDMLARAKLMFINYPNNPTSATADRSFFEEVVEFAKENNIIVVHDNAYSEMVYDGYQAPSFLSVDGAMDVGIELYSLSKTYNMTGWRLAFAVGNEKLVKGLGKVKSNIDSGAFDAIQKAGITALTGSQQCVSDMNRIYEKRRDVLLKGLRGIGLDMKTPKATFYMWAPVPSGYDSMGFSQLLLEKAGIVATPGVGFGQYGEGYIRFALTQSVERINEAVSRMENLICDLSKKRKLQSLYFPLPLSTPIFMDSSAISALYSDILWRLWIMDAICSDLQRCASCSLRMIV
jgi:LL-diaminopimelate aminotransferase